MSPFSKKTYQIKSQTVCGKEKGRGKLVVVGEWKKIVANVAHLSDSEASDQVFWTGLLRSR